jgi:hypothetical protein
VKSPAATDIIMSSRRPAGLTTSKRRGIASKMIDIITTDGPSTITCGRRAHRQYFHHQPMSRQWLTSTAEEITTAEGESPWHLRRKYSTNMTDITGVTAWIWASCW